METIEELKSMMGKDADLEFPHFSHLSWCTMRLYEDCKISVHDLGILYKELVEKSGKSEEGYMKFFYCLVEYVRSVRSFEDWIKENQDQNEWIKHITDAGAYVANYEEDKEKWIADFREHLNLNPVPNMLDESDESVEGENN